MRDDGTAAEHVHQLYSGKFLFVLRTDEIGHQVEIPQVGLEHPGDHLLRFCVNSLENLLVLDWKIIESALEFDALAHQPALVGADKAVVFLIEAVGGVEDQDLAGYAQVLHLDVGVGPESCLVSCPASCVEPWNDGPMLYIGIAFLAILPV